MECTVDEKEMVRMLKEYIKERGTQRVAAMDLGISPAFLSDMILGKREVSDSVARKFGFSKVYMFMPLKVADAVD